MSILNRITRRTALAGKAALAGMAFLPGVAAARSLSPMAECSPGNATSACLPARWHSATAEELAGYVGDRFRVKSAEHGTLVLKLKAVEASASGPVRPGDLPRREGVTAVFESPDMAPLVADGYGTYRVSHPRIGSADLFMSAAPRRGGGDYIEVTLN